MQRGKSVVLYLIVGLAVVVAGVWAYASTALTGLNPGEPLPDFIVEDLAGQPVTTAQLVGRPLVLRFSALSCSQCAQDFRWLERLAATNPQLAVVAVQVEDEGAAVARALVNTFGGDSSPSFTVLLDGQGELAQTFGLRWLPAVYFVEADGRLAGSVWGEIQQQPAELEHFLRRIAPGAHLDER